MAIIPKFRGFWLGVCAMVLLPLFMSPAVAAGLKNGDTFGDWIADCPVAPNGQAIPCRLVQVQDAKTSNGQTVKLIKAAIMPLPNGQKILMGHLPLGYFVPAGVAFTVDDKKVAGLILQRCVSQGCEAATEFTPELAAAMRKGKEGKIEFRLGKQIGYLTISLNGISKALDGLK